MAQEESDTKKLIELLKKQATLTGSGVAEKLLRKTGAIPKQFKKVMPKPNSVR